MLTRCLRIDDIEARSRDALFKQTGTGSQRVSSIGRRVGDELGVDRCEFVGELVARNVGTGLSVHEPCAEF